MADINSLSFGCGNTLLANQLNIMADAIRSLITLVENIDDQVGSYIPLSGSEKITGVLAPKTHEGYDLGKSTNRWGTVWASTGGFKTIDFYDLQTPYGKLGELYIGKDTSNNNETILQFKHGNNNEEIVATREWVENQKSIKIRNSDNTLLGTISSVGTLNSGLFLQIKTNTSNPILLNNYNDDTGYCAGILFSDSDSGSGTISGNVLTVHNGNIYIDGDLYGAGGENGVSVLNDLSNVDASAPGTGDFLMYNGTGWVSNPLPESLIIHPSNISRNEEYYLMYEETNEYPSGRYSWVERPAGAKELNELNDVEINYTDLGLGQVLVYSQVTDEEDNTYYSWVNKTLSGSLTYDQSDSDKYLKVKNDGTGTEWSDISLSDLSNTEIGGSNNPLSNGLVLVYDSSSSKWKNTSLPANLPNTSTDNDGQYLTVENGIAKWVSVTPGSGLLWSDLTNNNTANIIHSGNLPKASSSALGIVKGDGLTVSINSSGEISVSGTLAGLNVESRTPSNGDILVYRTSSNEWKKESLPTGNLPSGGINGDHLIMGNNGPEWETSYNIYLVENGNKTLNGTITPHSTSNGGGIFIGTNKSGNIYSSLANPIILSPGTGGVQIANSGTGNNYALSTIKTSNDGNLILKSSVDTIIDTELGSQYIYLNGSRIYLSTDTSTNGHYLSLNNSNLLCYDGNVIGSGGGLTAATAGGENVLSGTTVTIPKASSDHYGVIKAVGRSGNATCETASSNSTTLNYKVLVDNSGVAFVNVPWTDSGARTYTSVSGGPTANQNLSFGGTFTVPYVSLDTNGQISVLNKTMTMPASQSSGSSNRTLENSTTRNNLKLALEQDGSICAMFDNVDSDSNVTSLNYARISELRYKAKRSLQSSFFFYKGTIDATNNIINPVFYVDLSYKIFLTKVTNTTNDYARINAFNSSNVSINTYSTWPSTAETVVKNLLLNKYGISLDFSTNATTGAYQIGTTNHLVLKTVNFYIEED